MKYYKYLDLDWIPSANKIKEYIDKNPQLILNTGSAWKDIDTQKLISNVPELLDMIAPLNINIRFIGLYISYASTGVIHIDEDSYSKCRINIPIMNCEDTETKFYTTDAESITVYQPNGVPLKRLNQKKCIYVDSYYLTQPVIFRNTEPHQVVVNHSKKPRVSCTIGFIEDIEYLIF